MRKVKLRYLVLLMLMLSLLESLSAQVWKSVKNGVGNNGGAVQGLYLWKDKLVVGGGFNDIDNVPYNSFAIWDGKDFSDLNGQFDYIIRDFTEYNGELIAVGNFTSPNKYIMRWDGSKWQFIDGSGGIASSEGLDAAIVYKGDLIVDGDTKWNGKEWGKLGTQQFYGKPLCMTIFKGDLYVGGRFTHIGSQVMNYIARWDGTSWTPVGKGFDYHVYSLFPDTVNDILYAGGSFEYADNKPASFIAQWNGTEWSSLGDSSFFKSSVLAIKKHNEKIYAGGVKTTNLKDSSFGTWDGNRWEAIQGPNSAVTSLEVYQGELYVGGSFNTVNGDSMFHIARWCDSTCIATGVSEKKKMVKGMQISPNPSDGFLKATIVDGNNTVHTIELYNTSGKRIFSTELIENEITLPMLSHPSGLYVLHILNLESGERYSAKVLVQH